MTEKTSFLRPLLGLRGLTKTPNIADSNSRASLAVSGHMLRLLDLDTNQGAPEAQTAGAMMERLIAEDLHSALGTLAPARRWLVERQGRKLSGFSQYEHLATLQRIIEQDTTKVLGMSIGREYEVKPDVTVGLLLDDGADIGVPAGDRLPLLHATVSCKLTIRSDRVQNIRQESAVLTRQRRGRLPHVIAVTLEPLPSRIASIARGTGDIDAVYHPALEELQEAVAAVGGANQTDILDELIGQRRLLPYAALAQTLATI